ncbi:glycosyltransferase family 4 protein [Rhodanobacter sp. BL-MT-08]
MKFLFVGTNPEHTGAATHFVALAQAMAQAGHDVSAVVYPDGLISHGLSQSNVRLHHARFRNIFDLRGYRAVFAAAKEQKPDWLVGNFGKEYWPLILCGRLLGAKVALFRHRTPAMSRISAYFLPRLADRFFAVSKYARQAYLDSGIPPELVQILYNPVNMDIYKPDPEKGRRARRQLGIPEDAIVVGYFGRMSDGKGIFTLLEAASAAMRDEPRLHCLWVGDGPDAADLRGRVASHRETAHRHHFTGWMEEVHPLYNAISMLAFPSKRPETFGRVSVEAQACGVPVLGSDVGGVPETLLADITGVLLPPAQVTAWRDAIVKLTDKALLQEMSRAANAFVSQHFSTLIVAENFSQILATAGSETKAEEAMSVLRNSL